MQEFWHFNSEIFADFKEHFEWILWISLIDFERNFANFRSDLGIFRGRVTILNIPCQDFDHPNLNVNPTLDLILVNFSEIFM